MEQLYKNTISEYLEELGRELDITPKEHKGIVDSYNAVGDWLSKDSSSLAKFRPKIVPQGSFMLGTIVRPINDEDDIDIDLVCKLEKKPTSWTQKDLKKTVGDRLKDHETYNRMLFDYKDGEYYTNGGRRCWTLKYSDQVGYHMDILPAFSDEDLVFLMERHFSTSDLNPTELQRAAIRITDTDNKNYDTDTDIENWNKSNPFGFAKWFFAKATVRGKRMFASLNESVDPVRAYEEKKLPLQRVVQLLKRHRDIMFNQDKYNSDNRPISIIITTLAARAYDQSENLIDAYTNIVKRMRNFITEQPNPVTGTMEKWVVNPVNPEENFADKWSEVPQKEEYFYMWLDKLETDLAQLADNIGKGQDRLFESFSNMYGNNVSTRVFSAIANNKRILRESGNLGMATGSGLLGTTGTKVKDHGFRGNISNGK